MRSSTPISRSLAASSITPLSHIENAASTNRMWSLSNSRSITLFRTLQRLQVGKCLVGREIPQDRPLRIKLGKHLGPVFGISHLGDMDFHDASYVAVPRGLLVRPFLLTVKEQDGVRVLFDHAGLVKVRDQWPLVASFRQRTVYLTHLQHRDTKLPRKCPKLFHVVRDGVALFPNARRIFEHREIVHDDEVDPPLRIKN